MSARSQSPYALANLGLWTASFVGMTLRVVFVQPIPHPFEVSARRLVVTFAGAAICHAAIPMFRRIRPMPFVVQATIGFLFALAGALAYGVVNRIVMFSILSRMTAPPDFSDVLFLASVQIYVFIAWGGIMLALGFAEEAEEKSRKLLAAQTLAAESQASMLRYQLNPHFLFNTLNALSTLILERNTAAAEKVVLSLSSFLRHALRSDASARVRLADELAAQREYLTIEQIRFGDRLRYVEEVPDDLLHAHVPRFILQPLVENAVKYGVAPSGRPVTVRISAARAGDRLRLAVTDDGACAGLSQAPRLGVGLGNVRARLELAYPEVGRLETTATDPGFRSVITLPYEPA